MVLINGHAGVGLPKAGNHRLVALERIAYVGGGKLCSFVLWVDFRVVGRGGNWKS